jgi:hypothetical protein
MSRLRVRIKIICGLFALCSALSQAEENKPDAGQVLVSAAISQWTSCIRNQLTEKISFIASPSYIADQILEQCDEHYLKLQQVMLTDMKDRNNHQDDQKTEQSVLYSLSDTKSNHRAKLISLVITHRKE